MTIIGKHFNDIYFEMREKASQEKAKAEAQAAREAALLAAAAPLQVQSAEQSGGDKALVLVNEGALSAAIQRQLNALAMASPTAPTPATAVGGKGGLSPLPPSASLASPGAPPLPAAAAANAAPPAPPAAEAVTTIGSPVPPAGAPSTVVGAADAGGVGLRRRAALTGLIREQLLQMDATMRTLAARLEELENTPQ